MNCLIVLLVSSAAIIAHGRRLEMDDVLEWSLNQFSDDEDVESYDADDDLGGFYGDALSADDSSDFDFETDTEAGLDTHDDVISNEDYSLMGCHGGKCEICFKVWKFKGCFIARIASDGIHIEFKAFGDTYYSQTLKTTKNFTVTVHKDKLPKWMRKLMKSDIKIKFSDINVETKKVCVQMEVKIKWVGTLKWPKKSPHCFNL